MPEMSTMDWVETGLLWTILLFWLLVFAKSIQIYNGLRDVMPKMLTNIRKMIAFMYISAHEEVAHLTSQEIHYVVKWVLIKAEERKLDHNELIEFTDEMLGIYLQEKAKRDAKKPKVESQEPKRDYEPTTMDKLQIPLE